MSEFLPLALLQCNTQEETLKGFYNRIHWALTEYDRIKSDVIPVTSSVLGSWSEEDPRVMTSVSYFYSLPLKYSGRPLIVATWSTYCVQV